jgi:hypothetical protein
VTQPKNPNGWCTNWGAYNVDGIWEMVAPETRDKAEWNQVGTWARIESMTHDHGNWLRAFQIEVERIWPSAQSPASAAFNRQIAMLVASMTETCTAAGRTKHALNDIMANLTETRAKIEDIRNRYTEAEGDLVIRQIDGAEDDLNDEARRIMVESEQAIAQRTPSIVAPPKFAAGEVRDDAQQRGGDDGSRGAGGAGGIGAGGHGAGSAPVRHDPPQPKAGFDPIMPDGKDWMPGYTGVDDSTSKPSDAPTLSRMAPPGANELPAANPNLNPGFGPQGGSSGLPSSIAGGVLGGGLAPMIGGGRPVGAAPSGPLSPFAGGTRTGGIPNGVIGGATAGGGGRGMTPGMMGPHAGKGNGQDPDSQWEVATGVAPVIAPDQRTDRHDPGPGVIGAY